MTTYTGSDGLTYDFTNNVLTISGSGASTSLQNGWLTVSGSSTSVDLRSMTALTTTGNVTSIGMNAAYNLTALVTVTIGDSVTTIGDYAFSGISTLKYVNLGAGVSDLEPDDVFRISGIEQFTVSSNNASYKAVNGVLFTKDGSTLLFYPRARADTSYTVPSGTTTIYRYSFYYVTNLQSISLPAGLTDIGVQAFLGSGLTSLVCPSSLLTIAGAAFSACQNMTSVTLNEGLTTIGANAFENCTSLTSVHIPSTVSTIGTSTHPTAFRRCTSVTQFSIAGGNLHYYVDSYGALYDHDLTTLIAYPLGRAGTSYVIPDTVTTIADLTFSGAQNLQTVHIPSGMTSIHGFRSCTSLVTVSVITPSSATSVASQAFYGCTSLKYITLPSSITSIGTDAFTDCTSLGLNDPITIPSSVTSIGARAFNRCTSLSSITIPASVTSIGANAFNGCTGLKELTMPVSLDPTPTSTTSGFTGCTNIQKVTLTVGSGTGITPSNYSGTPWYLSRANLTELIFSEGITSIGGTGSYAYEQLTALKSLIIPDSVTTIGSYSFYGCGFSALTIGSGVTTIKNQAFRGCASVKVLNFRCTASAGPNISFGTNCLQFKTSSPAMDVHVLSAQNWANGRLSSYGGNYVNFIYVADGGQCGDNAFWVYNSSDTSLHIIGSGDMYDYTNVSGTGTLPYKTQLQTATSFVIESGITNMGAAACSYSNTITSISLASTVKVIKSDAIDDLSSLTTLTFPEGVETLQWLCIGYCSALTSISIPSTVSEIAANFADSAMVYNLSTITVASGNTHYKSVNGVLYDYSLTTLVFCPPEHALLSSELPSTLLKIESGAIVRNSSLTSLTLPTGVTQIGDSFLAVCMSLTEVSLGKSLITLGAYAFSSCLDLTKIAFPSTLQSIDHTLCNSCSSLTTVVFKSTTTPQIGSDAFETGGSLDPTTIQVYSRDNWAEDALPEHPDQYTTLVFHELPPAFRTKVNGSWVIGTPKVKVGAYTNTELHAYTNTQLAQYTQDELSSKWVTAKAVYVKVNGMWKESERDI